jgi:NADH:ubiquinone oxidoreductase subunit K
MTHQYLIELIRKPISDRSFNLIRLLISTLILIVSIKISFVAPEKYRFFDDLPDTIQSFIIVFSTIGIIISYLVIILSLYHDKQINKFYAEESELRNRKSRFNESVSEGIINEEIMEKGKSLYSGFLNTSYISIILFSIWSTLLSILCVALINF